MDTHRIQEMHLLLSEILSLSVEMAPAGHFSAHCPQDVQADSAFGIIPAPAFLYGLFPGIDGLEKSSEDTFSCESSFDVKNKTTPSCVIVTDLRCSVNIYTI